MEVHSKWQIGKGGASSVGSSGSRSDRCEKTIGQNLKQTDWNRSHQQFDFEIRCLYLSENTCISCRLLLDILGETKTRIRWRVLSRGCKSSGHSLHCNGKTRPLTERTRKGYLSAKKFLCNVKISCLSVKGWLAIAKLKPLSLFISLFTQCQMLSQALIIEK